MQRPNVIICSFTEGLDELPRKKQASMLEVARHLAKVGRFSVFEATANQTIARTMDRIMQSGWFDRGDDPYPWTSVKLTPVGADAIERLSNGAGATLLKEQVRAKRSRRKVHHANA